MAINLTFTPPTDYHNQYAEDKWAGDVALYLNSIISAVNAEFTLNQISIIDSSMYWTAPDASIWSWEVTKV